MDFPLDEDPGFPISPVSSALDALCHLQPHSSIPTPSQLGFTWSSGDIPIILYDDGYAQDPYNGHINPGSFEAQDKDLGYSRSSNRLPTTSGCIDQVCASVSVLSMSGSSETICSGATFGARRQTSTWTNGSISQVGIPCQPSSASETLGLVAIEDSGEAKINDYSHETPLGNSEVLASFQAHNSKDLNLADWYFAPSISGTSIVASEGSTFDASSLLHNNSDFALEDTPTKETPRALSWISTREWNYEQYKDFVSRESPHQNRSESPCTSSTHRRVSERRRSDLGSLAHSSLVSDLTDLQKEFHSQDKRISHVLCSPYQNADGSWLKDTTVQLLIDQEGFRDAEPSFKFSGILRVRHSTDAKCFENIMAQFRPSSRQCFHFHHAPFESPPVLRRVTVNNDEAADYVSKQAHLILKSNGVYVVHGQETLSAEHNSEPVKLFWQFEYLVDDRRVETSGSKRNLEGEKIFTPLTFTCSPKLLSPTQAKRINIVQVFKKIMAPKLVAEKLQPPSSGRGINNSLTVRNGSRELGDSPAHLHTRLHHQHDPDATRPKQILRDSTHPTHHRDQQDTCHNHLPPSADNSRIMSCQAIPAAIDDRGLRHYSTTPSPHSIGTSSLVQTRHIVPPGRLSDLLTFNPSVKEDFPMPVTPERKSPRISATETPDRISEVFAALSPRPKHLLRK